MTELDITAPAPRDLMWMRQALILAAKAATLGEVPVGAIVVKDDEIIGQGYNQREQAQNPLKHAELDAIAMASQAVANWRLRQCELYVTLEPCVMCAGAIQQARLQRVIYGAKDPKAGAMGSLYEIHADLRLNHRLPVTAGVMALECSAILKQFFAARRSPP